MFTQEQMNRKGKGSYWGLEIRRSFLNIRAVRFWSSLSLGAMGENRLRSVEMVLIVFMNRIV